MNIGRRKKTDQEDNKWCEEDKIVINIPKKGIAMAFFLSILGFFLLSFGALTALGYLSEKYEDRILSFFILGALMFIPGSYHLFIAFCAYYRIPGYSFDDIPNLD